MDFRRIINILLKRCSTKPIVKIGKNVCITGRTDISTETIVEDGVVIDGNVSVGPRCRIEKDVILKGNISLGEGVVVGRYTQLKTMDSGKIKIGDNVLINIFSTIGSADEVSIGDDCVFAAFLQITDASHGFDKKHGLIRTAPWETSPVEIASNVWIGSDVTVLKGVTIGQGTVIGAKSLVNKDIPSDVVAFGIPASIQRSVVGEDYFDENK